MTKPILVAAVAKNVTLAKPKAESFTERQERMHAEASLTDRLHKPAGMDWGTYYKSL